MKDKVISGIFVTQPIRKLTTGSLEYGIRVSLSLILHPLSLLRRAVGDGGGESAPEVLDQFLSTRFAALILHAVKAGVELFGQRLQSLAVEHFRFRRLGPFHIGKTLASFFVFAATDVKETLEELL